MDGLPEGGTITERDGKLIVEFDRVKLTLPILDADDHRGSMERISAFIRDYHALVEQHYATANAAQDVITCVWLTPEQHRFDEIEGWADDRPDLAWHAMGVFYDLNTLQNR